MTKREKQLTEMIEKLLYCQLGGHLSPNATGKAVLNEARTLLYTKGAKTFKGN